MEKNNMFLVHYWIGEYTDTVDVNIFVTESEETAKAYCTKFNCILTKWKEYYKNLAENARLDDSIDEDSEEYYNIWAKYHKIEEVKYCSYRKIEIR